MIRCALFTGAISLRGLFVSSSGSASTINVNGTCSAGSCSNPDVLPFGVSETLPFNLVYTAANFDAFQIAGSYFTDNANPFYGSPEFFSGSTTFAVTFLGNGSNSVSSADSFTVDLLQIYQSLPSGADLNGYFHTLYGYADFANIGTGPSGPLASSSYVSYRAFLGTYELLNNYYGNLSESYIPISSPQSVDIRIMYNFGAGSGIGSSFQVRELSGAVQSSPEPSTWSLAALAAVALGLGGKKLKRC